MWLVAPRLKIIINAYHMLRKTKTNKLALLRASNRPIERHSNDLLTCQPRNGVGNTITTNTGH